MAAPPLHSVPPPPLSTPSGTRVSDMASDKELYKGQDVSVKGFATIDNVVLINVEVRKSVCAGEGTRSLFGRSRS